jgi:hypothetical protein
MTKDAAEVMAKVLIKETQVEDTTDEVLKDPWRSSELQCLARQIALLERNENKLKIARKFGLGLKEWFVQEGMLK